MKLIKKLTASIMLIGVMTLPSCVSNPQFLAYVAAHRQAYEATRPHYKSLIEASPIDEAAKATYVRRIDAEDKMITDAEKLLGIKQ